MSWQEEARARRDSEEAFQAADEEGKGSLTREDYKVAMLSLFGYKPSKYEVDSVWRDKCGSLEGNLFKERFVSLAVERIKKLDKQSLARQVFLAFDVPCRGFLQKEEWLRALQSVAPRLATGQVPNLFAEVDWNGDGRVSYRDFEIMMSHDEKGLTHANNSSFGAKSV